MNQRVNNFQQPVGAELPGWSSANVPDGKNLKGRYCRAERINVERHAAELYEAYGEATDGRDWTYLPAGPFETFESWCAYLRSIEKATDPMHYAVIDLATDQAVGTFSLMRIDAPHGVIEMGYVTYSPLMKRTRISTEITYLVLNYVFKELGYRRLEWKCDSLNAPSRDAAIRYGFTLEGVFRQAVVTHGRNRDTAWHSIINSEYIALCNAYEKWLSPSNFDENGFQQEKLSKFIAEERLIVGGQ
ncbi:GNAT family N-acetyltransferase [Pectobacterium versatile]|uniref:GNAT family N-acetyltransferase n=1 Tax=Pectobacterium versatile TaxID=2488639 RepID=UPI0015DEF9B3|nr:GNAT family protein [Pectobacterium versatile]MBA0172904.1 GNAT family N-acetyltransferase [Pectobacterium versatile]MCA6935469.1 GNAT family N-acetyltransferase [Pectobacterium versatile]